MAKATPQLAGAYRKLKRATRKLNEAEREISHWLARKPCEIVQENNPEGRSYVLRTVLREQPDLDWALEIGEAMGQVRSALDHLVQQLVTANGDTPSNRNAFPIYRSSKNFDRRKIKGIHPQWQAEIERLQPYNAPDPQATPLFRLNGIVQFDKHIDIHAIGVRRPQPQTYREGPLLTIEVPPNSNPGQFQMTDFGWDGRFVDGAVVHRVTTADYVPGTRLQVKEDLPIAIAFGDGKVMIGEMHSILKAVRKILARFEPAFI